MKISLKELNSRLEMSKKNASECKDILLKIMQSEEQRRKRLKKN